MHQSYYWNAVDPPEDVAVTERRIATFELEDSSHGHHNGVEYSIRQKLVTNVWYILRLYVIMAMIGWSIVVIHSTFRTSRGDDTNLDDTAETATNTKFIPYEPKMIICYGDSLTYGYPPPATPYSTTLERELNDLYTPEIDSDSSIASSLSKNETLKPSVAVQNLGIVGYTSKQMLDHIYDEKTGVCSIIEKEPYRPTLVIILAGTNDLVQMADTSLESVRNILQSILELHQQALSCNNVSKKDKDNSGSSKKMHTLAIGIPGSYTFDNTPELASRAKFVNDALKSYSSSTDGSRTDYFEFPFPYVENDVKWHADGTHMTEEGYLELGKALAPKVKEILDGM